MADEIKPQDGSSEAGRRRWLARVAFGIAGFVATVALVPFVGFLVAPVKREVPERWRRVGPVTDFPVGGTVKVTLVDPDPLPWAGFASESVAWLRRETSDRFVALSVYCTHVGCPTRWEEGAQLFLCPCHGGAFRGDGAVVAGPPPRPLSTHRVRVRAGEVEVETRPIPFAEV